MDSRTVMGVGKIDPTARSNYLLFCTHSGDVERTNAQHHTQKLWCEQCKLQDNVSHSWECYRRFGQAYMATAQSAIFQGKKLFLHRPVLPKFFIHHYAT